MVQGQIPKRKIENFMIVLLIQALAILVIGRVLNFYHGQIEVSDLFLTIAALLNFLVVIIFAKWFFYTQINGDYLNSMKEAIRIMRSERHDFINHLQSIYGLVLAGEKNDALKYMKDLGATQRFNSMVITITNPTLRVLLQNKKEYASSKGVEFKVTAHSKLKNLCVHPSDITTIFGNLIDNAIDILINQSKKVVHFKVTETENSYHFVVKDSGPPIQDDVINHIFTEGFSTKGDGRGYGLALVKHAVERYGGQITYENAKKEFVVILPRSGA